MGTFRPDALAQVTEESIGRLESGGIPVIAEQRLQDFAPCAAKGSLAARSPAKLEFPLEGPESR